MARIMMRAAASAGSSQVVVAVARVAHFVLASAQIFLPLLEHLLVPFVGVTNLAEEVRVVVGSHDSRNLPWPLRAASQPTRDDPDHRSDDGQQDDQRQPDGPAWAGHLGR